MIATKPATFTLVRNESGERKGKVDVWQMDQRIGPAEQFEFRKLGDGSIAIYHNDTLLGDIDKRSQDLIDWPLDNDEDKNDDNGHESPTDVRQRQHAAKIREQHLTEAFEQGMSIADVAERYGYRAANDGTFVKTSDGGTDVIQPLAGPGGAWEHRPAGDPVNSTKGRTPQELFDHLEFVASDYHDGPQLSKFLKRTLGLCEHLEPELGSAVLTYMRDHRASTYTEALREVTKANPILWEKHREQQIVQLID